VTTTLDKSILYWQGRSRNESELSHFHQELKLRGYSTEIMPIDYDTGLPPNNPKSSIYEWTYRQTNRTYDWWIGLSLGASVAYMVASSYATCSNPKRLTLINPFSNREKLAREKKFSLNGQWVINPINHQLHVSVVDIVLSVNDNRIPIEHGKSLLPMIVAKKIRVILLDADHAISDATAQSDLASFLLQDCKLETVHEYSKIISCNIC
jgi:hypothetical protein